MLLFLLGLFLGCCIGVFWVALLHGSRTGREVAFPERDAGDVRR
jgi:hypothetical protein